MMLEHSHQPPPTNGELTLSAEDSHVKTFPTPGSEQASTESAAGYGASSPESFAWYDRESSSWKTSQRCLFGGLSEFLGTWPSAGLMLNGECYRLVRLVPRTYAKGFFYWPTPAAREPGINHERIVDKSGNVPTHPNQRLYDKHTGRLVQDGLSQAVKMFPTPSSCKAANDVTLQASGDGRTNPNKSGWAVAMMPTPTSMTNTGGAAMCKWGGSGARKKLRSMVSEAELNGALNPEWVEWLMGFPLGWTDCQHSETPSSPKSPSTSGEES